MEWTRSGSISLNFGKLYIRIEVIDTDTGTALDLQCVEDVEHILCDCPPLANRRFFNFEFYYPTVRRLVTLNLKSIRELLIFQRNQRSKSSLKILSFIFCERLKPYLSENLIQLSQTRFADELSCVTTF